MDFIKFQLTLRRLATLMAIVILTLAVLAGATGALLGFYYHPAASEAYNSLKQISTLIPNGNLIHSLHNLSGNGIIAVALLQIVLMFLGRQFSRSWLTAWISGIFLTLNTIGLGWTAMILGWDQEGFWRLKVELGTIEAIPFLGDRLREIITGGAGINTTTVIHLYAIHSYLLSLSAIALAVVHLGSLVLQEREQKQMIRRQLEQLKPAAAKQESVVSN